MFCCVLVLSLIHILNTADMRLLQRVLVGETELTDTAALAADLNENGRPDAADLVLLAAKMQRD